MSSEDFMKMIDKQVADAAKIVSAAAGQRTIGELIVQLENIKNQEANIIYDFCNLQPTEPDSYRGFYDQLAFGWRAYDYQKPDAKVKDMLAWLKEAVGKTYTGYKGGEYVMSEDTMVWVDNTGKASSTGIANIIDMGHTAMIITTHVPH